MRSTRSDSRRARAPGESGLGLGLMALGLVACQPPTPPEPPAEAVPADEQLALEPAEPSNRQDGEQLELSVPGYDGATILLTELRGAPVVLHLGASWSETWAEAHEFYARLAAEGVQVIFVVNDPDVAPIEALGVVPYRLGWDPQGAVAAQVRAATFPTVIVLDAGGRIVLQRKGFDADAVRAALAG